MRPGIRDAQRYQCVWQPHGGLLDWISHRHSWNLQGLRGVIFTAPAVGNHRLAVSNDRCSLNTQANIQKSARIISKYYESLRHYESFFVTRRRLDIVAMSCLSLR